MLKRKISKLHHCGRHKKGASSLGEKILFPYNRHLERPPIRRRLDNGSVIVAEERQGSDIAIVAVTPYGMVRGPYKAHMLEHLSFRRTREKEADIDVQIERMGGFFTGYTQEDLMCLVIRVLKENSRKALGLLHRSLSNQNISERQLRTEKDVVVGECRGRKQNKDYELDAALNSFLWNGHGLYMPKETEFGTRRLTRERLIEAKAKYLNGGRNLVVGIIGPNSEKLLDEASETIGKLPKKGPAKHRFKTQKLREGSTNVRHIYTATQPECLISVAAATPGYGNGRTLYALEMLAQIVTGVSQEYGVRSRLWRRLRSRSGRMYHAYPFLEVFRGAGYLEFQVEGILQSHESSARRMIMDEIQSISRSLPEEEFIEARDALLLSKARTLAEESLEDAAERLALMEFYDVPQRFSSYEKEIMNLRPEDVKRVAARYFGEENYFIGVVKKSLSRD